MSANQAFRIKKSAILSPVASPTLSVQGEIAFDSAADVIKVRNVGSTDILVQAAATQVLTNKTLTGNTAVNLISGSGTFVLNTSGTITAPNGTDTLVGKATTDTFTNKTFDADGTGNSITNIENADIKSGANIARNKLASGTASHVLINDGSGVMSSEAQLDKTRGGTGISSTATFPSSGVVVTEAAVQTLTNKTLTAPVISTISNTGTLTLPTSTDTLVGRATTDTLTNKTLTSPVLTTPSMTSPVVTSGPVTIAEQATPSTPSSGNGAIYFKSDGFLYQLNDDGTESKVGSGGGGINYISANPDAESSTTGWATYKDAAQSTPVDGTGGSPTLTFTRTTSSPLRGTASFLITTTAANLQGEGASFDFTVPSADFAKPITVSFDYNIASGTYVTGDMTVYLYDVTNSTLIQPSNYQIQALGSSSITNRHVAEFQTSSNGTSYRLIFHRTVTTSSAMTMKVDNVQVGPTPKVYGAPITDWQSYSPNISSGWSSVSTVTGKWRRVGDSIEIDVNIAINRKH